MLNQRQKRLYKFLIDKSTTNEFISKEEICTNLQELYRRNEEKTNEHNSTAFGLIRRDIRAINSSDACKIILSNHQGYKIATEMEAIDFIERRFKRDLKSLKINWNLRRKVNLNHQMSIRDEGTIMEIKTFPERRTDERG